jgi:N-acetylmuramoyl-L-alanine amidase
MLNPSNQFSNQIFGPNRAELYNEGMNMYMIAAKIQKYLQQDGRIDAFISRNTQTQRTTLGRETQLTRALNCDVLYAIHSDATGTSDPGGGTWTFFAGDKGKKLADDVQRELVGAMKKNFYPDVKNMGTRTHWYRLWVLHEGGCEGALTEFLFHTNPKEREMLKNSQDQDVMAQAVAKGILKYFGFEP